MNRFSTSSSRTVNIAIGIALVCPVTWAAAAATQVYEWRERGGAQAFSFTAPPASVATYSIREIEAPAIGATERSRAEIRLAHEREILASADSSLPAIADEVARDAAALVRARQAQQRGREPLPEERQHTAHGGSHLTPAYFARQAHLDEAVAAAEAKLDKAELAHDLQAR